MSKKYFKIKWIASDTYTAVFRMPDRPGKETKILKSFVIDSTSLLLLAIVVNLLLVIKGIIVMNRRTNYVAYKTGLTVSSERCFGAGS